MRLLDLTLRRVRRHRELQLAFSPGLTPVGGAHESGKSTLVEALHKGLFLKATATGRGVEELRSRLHPGRPEVEIGFEAAGQRWTLRKRFAGSSGTCQLSHGGGLNLSGAAAAEQLAADQAVQLAGEPLLPGQSTALLGSGELQVGEGVRLRISPGGGSAPQQAHAQWQACQQALARQLEQLGVNDLEQTEGACSQRQALEAELQRLRQMLQQGIQQGLQIVLLSCTPELYAPLLASGGQRHQLEEPGGSGA